MPDQSVAGPPRPDFWQQENDWWTQRANEEAAKGNRYEEHAYRTAAHAIRMARDKWEALLARLADARDLHVPERERENLCACAHAAVQRLLTERAEAIARLDAACDSYCEWYAYGKASEAGLMTYELVTVIREVIAALSVPASAPAQRTALDALVEHCWRAHQTRAAVLACSDCQKLMATFSPVWDARYSMSGNGHQPTESSRGCMNYPNLADVEQASHFDLCRWQRFLQSPGMNVIGQPEFEDTLLREAAVMARIVERVKELGGFTPGISKALGW